MDDAPLLIKKSAGYNDKCGSCNQVLPHHNTTHSNCITEYNNNIKSNSKNKTKSLDKTEIINHFSTLGNLPDVNEKKNKTNILSPRKIVTPGMVKIRTKLQAQSFQKYDEFAERTLNGLIKDELDKNIINPDKLIKATKKVYDTIIDKKLK